MKRKFRLLALLFGAVLCTPVLTSCDSDDDEPIVIPVFDPANTLYKGETETNYTLTSIADGSIMPGSYSTESIKFNLVLDTKRNLATVNIIDASFAQGMPALTLRIEGLAYNASKGLITGQNLSVKMLEGGQYTPYPDMTFTDFKAVYKDAAHTEVEILFTVSGKMGPRFNFDGTGEFESDGVLV